MHNFFKRLWNATVYSLQGIIAAWRSQWVFPLEVITFLLSIPVGLYFGKTAVERILLISSVLLILIMELLNSAVETVVDRISREQHELSGRAKDLASAAVFLSVLNAVMVWAIILISRIF